VVDPQVAPILSDLVWQYGEPYGDSSMIPSYLIAREARKFVTVVLTGDGGDEAFAGYSRHLRADRARRFSHLTPLITQGVVPMAAKLVSMLAPRTMLARNFDLSAKYLSGSRQALAGDTCWFDGMRKGLYTKCFMDRLQGSHPLGDQAQLLAGLKGPTHVDRALEHLLLTTLPNDYLVKVDVATMAHSLEARCPFLDVDLLNFAMTIPSALLVEGNLAKSLLKRYAATLVPPEVIYRKKQGFAVPVKHWLRDSWRQGVENLLLSKAATDRQYFEPAFVRKVLNEHTRGRRNHGSRIWTLLVLEIWNRLFVDRSLQPGQEVFPAV
jgi:asparagine synthase (glutamine-hydrolysing)